ncbi:MAG TPA: adenosylcobinamide-GDP ribazoletransferase [bacterium]|nr:adenosylcobinamide-GDP ribazoletransferase [bacterium]
MLKDIVFAFQFLTRIPLPSLQFDPARAGRSMRYYPLVGIFIGELLVLLHLFLARHLPVRIENMILLVFMAAVTGAFHLDGFADTVDAFFSVKDRDKMLAIMKDSRVGAIGAIGLILLLLAKFELLCALPAASKNAALFLMPVLSRWSMPVSARVMPYARAEDGLGRSFCESVCWPDVIIASLIAFVPAVALLGMNGLTVISVAGLSTGGLLLYAHRKIKGITGDVMGFIAEILEVVILLFFVAAPYR